ncbi:MAG: hypothetical protein DRI71_02850 [Bacteroidetes bacterium]|nr:MAG: hypothetical protein DRI71_02850 [Bacteroidota bacterium]
MLNSCEQSNEYPVQSYNVSGKAVDSEGLGVDSVKLFYSSSDSVYSDKNGNWNILALTGANSIIPYKNNYIFNPTQVSVSSSQAGIIFIATDTTSDYVLENELKVYNWFENLQLANGLLESAENSNIVSLYDNALAALVFISYGNFERAEKIFDFFNLRIESELTIGNGGFSQFRDRDGIPGNHRWMGDNAWLLIALNNYKTITGNTQYIGLADAIEAWLRSLQDTDGGLWGGYSSDDTQIHKITEGNIDAFNAIPGYDSFHINLLNFLENDRWDATDKLLIAWPGNVQYKYALDLHCWGYCIFEDFPESVLTEADRYITTKTATVLGTPVTGYCFDIDKDVVWLEGTGEMVVAFQKAGLSTEADYYIVELEKMIIESSLFSNSSGIPYTTNNGTHYGSSQLWDGVDTNQAISSGAWYLFNKRKFNPFETGRVKNIPEEDKFWRN